MNDKTSEKKTRTPAAPAAEGSIRMDIRLAELMPDPNNRPVIEDEEFASLVDSMRLFGILEPIKVSRGAESYDIFEGHRRRRAAEVIGLDTVPCEVWPAGRPEERIAMGLALNTCRKPPSPLQVAKRLRQLRNDTGDTHEQLAARTGVPLQRVRYYLGLFGASDALLELFEATDVSLRLAVELMRYEKSAGELAARRFIKGHEESPLTVRQVMAARARHEAAAGGANKPATRQPLCLVGRVEAALANDRAKAVAELSEVLAKFGMTVVETTPAATSA